MLTVMVFALGSVSGAHLNPAVTFAIALRGRMAVNEAATYMAVQIVGGFLGAFSYSVMTGGAFILAPAWQYTAGAAVAVELMYSALLCYVVLNVATTAKDTGNQYFGLAIGLTVTSAAVAVGSISGCSLNPAVSFGSMLAGAMRHGFSSVHFWALYILTPFLGAYLAALMFLCVRPEESIWGGFKRLPMSAADTPPESPAAPAGPAADLERRDVPHPREPRVLRPRRRAQLRARRPEPARDARDRRELRQVRQGRQVPRSDLLRGQGGHRERHHPLRVAHRRAGLLRPWRRRPDSLPPPEDQEERAVLVLRGDALLGRAALAAGRPEVPRAPREHEQPREQRGGQVHAAVRGERERQRVRGDLPLPEQGRALGLGGRGQSLHARRSRDVPDARAAAEAALLA